MHDVDRLFRTYNEMLVRYLTRRLGDRDWAEEVAQETFVRALRQETMTNERAWLFTVANNLVRDDARKDSRRRRHLSMLYEEEKERVVEPEETTIERAQDAAMARAAVDGLAERDRLALLMKEEGLDYSEIASALGMSVGSIGTTLSRARRRLVEQYERLQQERERGGKAMQHLDEGTIHAWLDGELPPAEREAVEAHVAACDECKAAVAEARGFIAASSRILMALDAVPGGVLPASAATTKKTRAPSRFVISRAWMAAAALLVLSTATVIAVRPRRDAAIATVAARDESSSPRAEAKSAPSAAASAPMVANAPEPSPTPSEKAEKNAPMRVAQGKLAPRDEKDALRKKVERAPMVVAEAPTTPPPESAKLSAQTGDPGASTSIRARSADAMAAQAPAPAPMVAAAPAPFADSAGSANSLSVAPPSSGIPITGRVVSEAGAPLGTASVTLEGTGVVTLTRDDGSYAMTVPASRVDGKPKTLVARLLGYKAVATPIVVANNAVSQDFVLYTNPLRLGEIVMTGAGTSSSVEKFGVPNAADSTRSMASAGSRQIRIRGSKTASTGPKARIAMNDGTFAQLTSHSSSGGSGEPIEISVYSVNGVHITFIDRLRPDTTRAYVDTVTEIEDKYDKEGATINRLAWTDSQGRMRTLRGPVSTDILEQLKRALDLSKP